MLKAIVSAFVGAVLGIIGARYLFVGSALSLIPWGAAGLLIGLWTNRPLQALGDGGLYGFVLSFVFMASGYSGSAALITRLPFFAILGLVGAICGAGLACGAWFLKSRILKK
jgi:hypothetical protein